MTFDIERQSPAFREFYEAFSPRTYGRSMGRAADHAMYLYDDFSDEEKALATAWFLELFSQEAPHWGYQYLRVIEAMDDTRFVPLLEAYCARLKVRHKRGVKTELNGETVVVRPDFRAELRRWKTLVRHLKRRR